jgi:hypothetical protein
VSPISSVLVTASPSETEGDRETRGGVGVNFPEDDVGVAFGSGLEDGRERTALKGAPTVSWSSRPRPWRREHRSQRATGTSAEPMVSKPLCLPTSDDLRAMDDAARGARYPEHFEKRTRL